MVVQKDKNRVGLSGGPVIRADQQTRTGSALVVVQEDKNRVGLSGGPGGQEQGRP